MKERKRIPTDGEPIAWKSPFAALKNVELPGELRLLGMLPSDPRRQLP